MISTNTQRIRVIIKDLKWLWANSLAVDDSKGFVLATRRARFFIRALAVLNSVSRLINAPANSPLDKLMKARPQTVGAVIWPYQCVGWDARARLSRIYDHYSVIEMLGEPLNFPVDGQLLLLDLRDVHENLKVIVDQPLWFIREGQLTISLFLDETRIYSLSFSLFHENNELAAFVGALQGRDLEGILDKYRELTKACHGMRPRDFLIEIFRALCCTLGVAHIFAVSDEHRHHRSRYFGKAVSKKDLSTNYNQVWQDRGAVRVNPMFYRLEIVGQDRDLPNITAKKRAMYRRRYEMLKSLREQLNLNYKRLKDGFPSSGRGSQQKGN